MRYGSQKDVEAIHYAICCGIKGIFTAHGKTIKDLEDNPCIQILINQGLFDRIIFLDEKRKGKVKQAYKKDWDEKGQPLLIPI